MYTIKNPRMLYVMSFETGDELYRNGIIALGCKIFLNCKNPFLIISKWRIILNPPDVLPADPPKNIIPKNNKRTNGDHAV